jgi:hypothetical protein
MVYVKWTFGEKILEESTLKVHKQFCFFAIWTNNEVSLHFSCLKTIIYLILESNKKLKIQDIRLQKFY